MQEEDEKKGQKNSMKRRNQNKNKSTVKQQRKGKERKRKGSVREVILIQVWNDREVKYKEQTLAYAIDYDNKVRTTKMKK